MTAVAVVVCANIVVVAAVKDLEVGVGCDRFPQKNIDNTHLILKAIPHRRTLILGSGPRIDPFFLSLDPPRRAATAS